MGRTKRAIMDIQERGWPVNNESLKRLVQERDMSAEQQEMVEIEDNVFMYLELLKESAKINMLGAVPHIMEEFEVKKDVARILLKRWMNHGAEGN